jgi:hypothetical protein
MTRVTTPYQGLSGAGGEWRWDTGNEDEQKDGLYWKRERELSGEKLFGLSSELFILGSQLLRARLRAFRAWLRTNRARKKDEDKEVKEMIR